MTLYFMVGLPRSGKTELAKMLSKITGAIRFSSDDLRKKLNIDGGDCNKHEQVFDTLNKMVVKELENGNDCIYDATNISGKKRVHTLNYFRNKVHDLNALCVVVATPYQYCLIGNANRKDKVPTEVIKRMYLNWCMPYYSEGWDTISLYYREDFYRSFNGKPVDYCNFYYDWDQKNKHHVYGLGKHMQLVGNNFSGNGNLQVAGYIHDCGKIFTQQETENGCIYYNHHNVSSYEAMFFDVSDYDNIDLIYISFLVNHHMDPFFWKDNFEKGKVSFANKYGTKELNDIMALHYADKFYAEN